MRRENYFPYFLLALLLFFLTGLSPKSTSVLRSFSISALHGPWQIAHAVLSPEMHCSDPDLKRAFFQLEVENRALKEQLDRLQAWVLSEKRLNEETERFNQLSGPGGHKEFLIKRRGQIQRLLKQQLCSLPAKVIFRSPDRWNNSVWIDVGEIHNQPFAVSLIAKNSPVLAEGVLIGIVEYVGERQSMVRLVTDPDLTISVEIASKEDGRARARGEIFGCSGSVQKKEVLQGVIFNLSQDGGTESSAGDLLLTTGFDGIFPAGLPVAFVAEMGPLREGVGSTPFKAKSALLQLNALREVIVLPPLGFEFLREKSN